MPNQISKESDTSFGTILLKGAKSLISGVSKVSSLIPHKLITGAENTQPTQTTNNESFEQIKQIQQQSQQFNLKYLELQQEIQEENRRYTALSNVLKANHDTVKSVLTNLRA